MSQSDTPEPCELVPSCPICSGHMVLAAHGRGITICVCTACGTSLSVPDQALDDYRKRPRSSPGE
jgi:hypothetical protein